MRVPLADDATTHFFAPVEMNAALNRENGSGKRNGKKSPACLFCYSLDTMEPFRRSSHVAILSRFMPRLRWRYCRSCTRHFLAFIGRPQRA